MFESKISRYLSHAVRSPKGVAYAIETQFCAPRSMNMHQQTTEITEFVKALARSAAERDIEISQKAPDTCVP